MLCKKCGKELPDDAAFCLKCGYPVEQSVNKENEEKQDEIKRQQIATGLEGIAKSLKTLEGQYSEQSRCESVLKSMVTPKKPSLIVMIGGGFLIGALVTMVLNNEIEAKGVPFLILLGVVCLLCIVILTVSLMSNYSHRSKEWKEAQACYSASKEEYENLRSELEQKISYIPDKYRKSFIVEKFSVFFRENRVNSIEQAIALYEEERRSSGKEHRTNNPKPSSLKQSSPKPCEPSNKTTATKTNSSTYSAGTTGGDLGVNSSSILMSPAAKVLGAAIDAYLDKSKEKEKVRETVPFGRYLSESIIQGIADNRLIKIFNNNSNNSLPEFIIKGNEVYTGPNILGYPKYIIKDNGIYNGKSAYGGVEYTIKENGIYKGTSTYRDPEFTIMGDGIFEGTNTHNKPVYRMRVY